MGGGGVRLGEGMVSGGAVKAHAGALSRSRNTRTLSLSLAIHICLVDSYTHNVRKSTPEETNGVYR